MRIRIEVPGTEPARPRSPRIDYAGREEFLYAADRIWQPAPLASLALVEPAVRAWVEPILERNEQETYCRRFTWRALAETLAEDSSSEAQKAREALATWAGQYPVTDSWFREAAVHTVLARAHGLRDSVWWYDPGNLEPPFEPRLWGRFRHGDDPREFEQRQVNRLRLKLRAHLRTVQSNFGDRAGNTARDAELTARHLWGKSYNRIAHSTSRATDETTVRSAVVRFARRIGLTLVDTLVGPHQKQA